MTGMARRVLVAGIGNVFLGDDAFGVEVARRLATEPGAPGVDVIDVGTGGVHLAYELLDGRWAALVLVDAIDRDDAPGTLFVLEPELCPDGPPGDAKPADGAVRAPVADGHGMDPGTVLELLQALGAMPERVLVVGCQPGEVVARMGLSPPVAAVVDQAAALVAAVAAGELRRLGPVHVDAAEVG